MGADEPEMPTAPASGEPAPSAPSADRAQPIPGRRPSEAEFEHLQWLGVRDQQVLCRGECASALREESRLLNELRNGVFAHHRAAEHCKAASENDSDWFTLDVQDCHNRKAKIMADVLQLLEGSTPPLPKDSDLSDRVFGNFFNGYAQSAQAVVAAKDSEQVQHAAASVRTAWGALRQSFLQAGFFIAVPNDVDHELSVQAGGNVAAAANVAAPGPGQPAPAAAAAPPAGTADSALAAAEGGAGATNTTSPANTAAEAVPTSSPTAPPTVLPAAPVSGAAVDKNPQRPTAPLQTFAPPAGPWESAASAELPAGGSPAYQGPHQGPAH